MSLFISTALLVFSPSLFALLLSACAFALLWFFKRREKPVFNSPMLGKPGDPDFQAALTTGYKTVGQTLHANEQKGSLYLFQMTIAVADGWGGGIV